jgi:hypothetical protein
MDKAVEMIGSNNQGSKLLAQEVYPKTPAEKGPECPNLLPCFTIWGTISVYDLQADPQLPMAFEA